MKIEDISKTEDCLVVEAGKIYGDYFEHAQFAVNFLSSFVKSVKPEAVFFTLFLAQIEKHIMLGFLSAVRLHHVQCNFDFRYALEAGAWASFAMANYEKENFAESNDDETIKTTQTCKEKMYKWIETNYSLGNESIKRVRGSLNMLSAHANIIDAYRNFSSFTEKGIGTLIFDEPEEHYIKTDLWTIGNLVMGLLDLFYGVNKDYKVLELQDNFLVEMQKLKENNNKLKVEMMNHPRLKRYAKNL